MRIKCAPFMGVPETAILAQPWVTTPPLCKGGVPLGLSMEVRHPELWDPWELMETDQIHSTFFSVTGQKKHGKSTSLKHISALTRNMQAGSRNGVPERMRVRYHDRKREAADPEYGPITTALGGEVFSLNQHGLINLFDPAMGMTQLDILDVAANTVEHVRGMPLVGHMMLALQVAIWRMRTQMRSISSPEVLEVALRTLDPSDKDDYFDACNNDVRQMFNEYTLRREVRDDYNERKELDYLYLCMERPDNVNDADFRHDAQIVSEAFGRLLRGDYGRVFGGTRSLRRILSADVADIVWTGMPEKAVTLVEALLWKWQDVGLNADDTSIIPHIEIGDEEHEAFSNLMHVRFYSAYVAKARQIHTARFSSTQQITDYTMAGDAGSEIRKLSEKIVRGIGGHFIGRMPNDNETRHLLAQLGISKYDIEFLCTMIPQGCFGVKLPDRTIKFIQITPTRKVLELADTNTATRRMTNRIPWMSLHEVRHRAEVLGLIEPAATS